MERSVPEQVLDFIMSLGHLILNYARNMAHRFVIRLAWFAADLFGWRAAMPVYPAVMRGKVAIVTGANSGLGFETTKALLKQGATVIMACRTLERGQDAKREILDDASSSGPINDANQRLIPLKLDLEDFPSVQQFVADFHSLGLPLHLLVNNAGVHLKPYARASLGFERTMAVNYFSPFWLTQLLLDDLKASAPSRIVNTASIGEAWGIFGWPPYTLTIPYDDIPGYGLRDSGERPYVLSKTMTLMANTRELARRLEGTGVDVFAIHPGVVNSPWYLKVDPQAYTFSWIIHTVRSVIGTWIRVGQPPATGAISLIYASIDPYLTGATSSPRSWSLVDLITRTAFGGRLKYFGPSYIFQNWNNAGTSIALNPWVYSRRACRVLYDTTLRLSWEVERKLARGPLQQQNLGLGVSAQQQQQYGAANGDKVVAAAIANGAESKPRSYANVLGGGVQNGDVKAAQRPSVADAPLGPSQTAKAT